MKVILEYDNDDLFEVLDTLTYLLNDLNGHNDDFFVSYHGGVINAINLIRLKCYEKHLTEFKFHTSLGYVVYDQRVGRRLIPSETPNGFMQINKSDFVNLTYVDHIKDNDVYVIGEKDPRKIGKIYRRAVYDRLKNKK